MPVFALFFRPHPGGFDSSRVSSPRNLPSKANKMLMPGDYPGGEGWAQLELTDTCWTQYRQGFSLRVFQILCRLALTITRNVCILLGM